MATEGKPLNIYEKTLEFNEKPLKILTITANSDDDDDFIDNILTRIGWYGAKLSSVLFIYINDYPFCCFNQLNMRSAAIDATNLWNYLCSNNCFRTCFRSNFYIETDDYDESFIRYSKQIAEIINTKDFGNNVGVVM